MRPLGEVHEALLQACYALLRPGRAPTMREMAHRAQVAVPAATGAVSNMVRAGVLVRVRQRKVAHCSRSVAEYMPAELQARAQQNASAQVLAAALATWGR